MKRPRGGPYFQARGDWRTELCFATTIWN